ncbi:DUF4870 domain-containing protein [Methylobacillus caricis]|uniref:DUF4870 domain-containing protein n=1 Tax=Methylobacillus caricis TaxID=1971611 RepID=UPI001CFF65C8|nr:DUF4870 domain-containing protein [Methylobacillus caricis]MCB5188328.1 DUF4870 domain-containing protein [Methylobacillus caricis]
MSNLIPVASADEKNIAVLTHLGGTLFSLLPALIVWLLKKDDSEFIGTHAREALNFQITLLIGYAISSILIYILIGFVIGGILWIANIILCIIAAIAASRGEEYRYPFTLRLIS